MTASDLRPIKRAIARGFSRGSPIRAVGELLPDHAEVHEVRERLGVLLALLDEPAETP